MKLVDQWRAIEAGLPPTGRTSGSRLTTEQAERPAARRPGARLDQRRQGRLDARLPRSGAPAGRRALRRRDASSSGSTASGPGASSSSQASRSRDRRRACSGSPSARPARSLVADELGRGARAAPSDWTDLLCELEIDSSDAARPDCAPLRAAQPDARDGSRLAFTFRCSGRSGYGVSPAMARRCFERLDDDGIAGSTRCSACSPTRTTSTPRGQSGSWAARRCSRLAARGRSRILEACVAA